MPGLRTDADPAVHAAAQAGRLRALRCRAAPHAASSIGVCIALNLAELVLFAIAGTLTVMSVNTGGQERAASLITGPAELEYYGVWELSVVVLITTFVAPLARTLCTLRVLLGLRAWPGRRSCARSSPGLSICARGL